MRASARAARRSPAPRSNFSKRRRCSSERRAPAAARPLGHFRHPAAYPRSSSTALVMFTRLGAGGARGIAGL
eukprot:9474362-Alexandrium_andersonii.AAC.1